MWLRMAIVFFMGCLLMAPVSADDDRHSDKCRVTGTWLVNIEFPDIHLRFQELLTLHRGGTLTETNSGLHANSFPDPGATPMPPPAPPALNGSDGHGAWRPLSKCHVQWSFLKMAFAGADTTNPDGSVTPAGAPVGFLRVRTVAEISGDQYYLVPGKTSTELLFGPDPNAPIAVQPFPDSIGIGYRLLATD